MGQGLGVRQAARVQGNNSTIPTNVFMSSALLTSPVPEPSRRLPRDSPKVDSSVSHGVFHKEIQEKTKKWKQAFMLTAMHRGFRAFASWMRSSNLCGVDPPNTQG